ncbi:MAG: arylesterase [Tsuneonella sp.]
MRKLAWSILGAAALLAGCKGEAPTPTATPAPSATSTPAAAATPISGPVRTILAFGDSLFAGYGLIDPGVNSYPAQLETALRRRGINAHLVNAGIPGDTTAAGLQRLQFTLDGQGVKPDLALILLGGNDLLRGLPPAQTRANLEAILDAFDKRGIPVVLMGMRAPPNAGPQFQAAFDAIYPALAKEHHATLVPFFLQSVYNNRDLIQPDHIHPTTRGIGTIVAATADTVAQALPKNE